MRRSSSVNPLRDRQAFTRMKFLEGWQGVRCRCEEEDAEEAPLRHIVECTAGTMEH